jgi:hypothetical protein
MYREIIDVCFEIHKQKRVHKLWAKHRIFNAKPGGTYSNA